MFHRRLSFFLAIALLLPMHQVIKAQRDTNAEETVAANFLRLRHESGLAPMRRGEGNVFSQAACEAAAHGNPAKVWVEDANYAAMIYSIARPDDARAIGTMATRLWKGDQRFVVGVCAATTPAFPSGRYWVAFGVIGGVSERTVADLLSGRPVMTRARTATSAQPSGE